MLIILAPSRPFPPKLAELETHLQRGAEGGIHLLSHAQLPWISSSRECLGSVSLGIGFLRGMGLIIPRGTNPITSGGKGFANKAWEYLLGNGSSVGEEIFLSEDGNDMKP